VQAPRLLSLLRTAAHLVDRVSPEVPIRQWVLTLPYSLRFSCAYNAKLMSKVLRVFVRSLFPELPRRVWNRWGEQAEQCGAVTFIQRFGSALNLNVRFHTLALGGDAPIPRRPSCAHGPSATGAVRADREWRGPRAARAA